MQAAKLTPLANTGSPDYSCKGEKPVATGLEFADAHVKVSPPPVEIEVALLTAGTDKTYAFGLANALLSKAVQLDFIGSEKVDSPELRQSPNLRFLKLRGDQNPSAKLRTKAWRILVYYARLIGYAFVARPKVFHILWNNRFQTFDRTMLMLYYKLLGKKIAFTAHNVNAGKRDSTDSFLNRLTLKIQYRLADHIFVHTDAMKSQLLRDFGVHGQNVTVVPFGINNCVPRTGLTPSEAKRRLGIGNGDKTILFFGRIVPYKGLQFLISAFAKLAIGDAAYRLIIAGSPGWGCEAYMKEIRMSIDRHAIAERIIQKIEFIPDDEIELYFKAADALVLPYMDIFQSGVLFIAYSFGLPVIASDVGSLREEVVEGRTGFVCKPCDPVDLARAIKAYFNSDLFEALDCRRPEIRDFAAARHSWSTVGEMTQEVYVRLLGLGKDGRS